MDSETQDPRGQAKLKTDAYRRLLDRADSAARDRHESNVVESSLFDMQRFADRADAWALRVTDRD